MRTFYFRITENGVGSQKRYWHKCKDQNKQNCEDTRIAVWRVTIHHLWISGNKFGNAWREACMHKQVKTHYVDIRLPHLLPAGWVQPERCALWFQGYLAGTSGLPEKKMFKHLIILTDRALKKVTPLEFYKYWYPTMFSGSNSFFFVLMSFFERFVHALKWYKRNARSL